MKRSQTRLLINHRQIWNRKNSICVKLFLVCFVISFLFQVTKTRIVVDGNTICLKHIENLSFPVYFAKVSNLSVIIRVIIIWETFSENDYRFLQIIRCRSLALSDIHFPSIGLIFIAFVNMRIGLLLENFIIVKG